MTVAFWVLVPVPWLSFLWVVTLFFNNRRRLRDAEAALRISRINAQSLERLLRIAEKRAVYHEEDATYWRKCMGANPSDYSAFLSESEPYAEWYMAAHANCDPDQSVRAPERGVRDPRDVDACKEQKP